MPRSLTTQQILDGLKEKEYVQTNWFPNWQQFAQDHGFEIRHFYNDGMGGLERVSENKVRTFDTNTFTNEPDYLTFYNEDWNEDTADIQHVNAIYL